MKNIYTDGTYAALNPHWHDEDAAWKADQVIRMLRKHHLPIKSVAEIGCGAGGVLAHLHQKMSDELEFHGFDIAPEAIFHAKKRESQRLHFYNEDLLGMKTSFDLLLVIDVIEHIPDYLGFLEGCRQKGRFKLYHIPLDIHISSVIRSTFDRSRITDGHIHYFSAETAISALTATGHIIRDSLYTDGGLALAAVHPSLKRYAANIPRKFISLLSTKWSARLLGGYSLLVLAE
ncbi:MAG: class I SAM-dependent methyltransferase [Nitrospiraceae bacterium]|nr:MAG: class I SAM-dependent methyltransferase [Nitrospiraceae bacterium]